MQSFVADTLQDDKIYDGSFQGRAEKLAEELAEAEEDKAALARDNARLAVEKAGAEESLAESQDSKIAMSNEIHGLGVENDRLEQELKDARDSLEEAEDDRAALSRNVEKLTFEKTYLEKSSPAPGTSFARSAPSAPRSGRSPPSLFRNTPTPTLTPIPRLLPRGY